MRSMNLGTSYLVAPINKTANPKLKDDQANVKEFLKKTNTQYIKKLKIDTDSPKRKRSPE